MSTRSTHTAEALDAFFNGFGIPAFEGTAVPDKVPGTNEKLQPPYITYQLAVPDILQTMPFYAEVWYRSRSLVELNAKVDQIESAIGEGVSIPTRAGAVRIYRGSNFRQTREFAGDPTYRCAYLNMMIAADTL